MEVPTRYLNGMHPIIPYHNPGKKYTILLGAALPFQKEMKSKVNGQQFLPMK